MGKIIRVTLPTQDRTPKKCPNEIKYGRKGVGRHCEKWAVRTRHMQSAGIQPVGWDMRAINNSKNHAKIAHRNYEASTRRAMLDAQKRIVND